MYGIDNLPVEQGLQQPDTVIGIEIKPSSGLGFHTGSLRDAMKRVVQMGKVEIWLAVLDEYGDIHYTVLRESDPDAWECTQELRTSMEVSVTDATKPAFPDRLRPLQTFGEQINKGK